MASLQKIMIIDDERDGADLVMKRLKVDGYAVHCLYSGKHAIETINQIRPDLILLYIWLPDISGRDIFSKLFSQICHAEAPDPK